MTQYERLSLVLSAIALVVSITTPIASYYWLDPTLQALRHRRPLEVDQYDQETSGGRTYFLRIRNPGTVGATDVKIVITTTAWGVPNPPAPVVEIDPPSPFGIEAKGNVATVSLQRPLRAGESLEVRIPEVRNSGGSAFDIYATHVYSDFGGALHRNYTTRFFFGGGQFGNKGATGQF